MAIKGILFDKDGTIVDFKATFDPATERVLKELCAGDHLLLEAAARALGFDLESATIASNSVIVAGSSLDIASVLGTVFDRLDVAVFAAELDQKFGRACASTVTELPSAIDSLKQLHADGYHLGVATNDAAANAVTQMERLEIHNLFRGIYGADSGFGAKPEPGMIGAFIDALDLSPEEVLMVGDSTHDLKAGRAANVATCGVETGPASRETLAPFADHILGSIVQLPGLVGHLNGK